MWVLLLNDMRSSKIEILCPVVRAETKQELLDFLAREKVPAYRDDGWSKNYRQGGPLEWFNPPWGINRDEEFQDVGTEDDWAEGARRRFQDQVLSLPVVGAI